MLKKCLLVAPSRKNQEFPRGILSIATFLRKNGIEAEVLIIAYDLMKENKNQFQRRLSLEIGAKIRDCKPEFIGVSNTFTNNYYICLEILNACKKINSDIKTGIGGQHVTFLDGCVLNESQSLDFVIRGEGEWTMLRLLKALPCRNAIERVEGISFRRGKMIIRNPDRKLGDLSELPVIDYSLVPEDFVKKSTVCSLLVRGCNFNCSFCSDSNYWGRTVRVHPMAHFLNEMDLLFGKYKKTEGRIEDSMLNMRCQYFYDFCHAFQQRKKGVTIPSNFSLYSRIDTISDRGLSLLKKTGINALGIGIESGSEKVLKSMNKGIKIAQIISNLKLIKKHGFTVQSNWIIGHPGDNPREAQKTLDFIRFLYDHKLIDVSAIWKFLPFPGCKFFHKPQKYGVEILSFDWSKWRHDTDDFLCQLKDFTASEIQRFYAKANAIAGTYGVVDRYAASLRSSNKPK